MSSPSTVRCRQIAEPDLKAVADLLARGFPARSPAWWRRGLERMASRAVPDGYPRFGFLLDRQGEIVGALLLIFAQVGGGEIRCNLSSWYVEPDVRSHAALLGMMPLRYKTASFLNGSAAPNTWATIEAQGFRRYTAGQLVALPALAASGPDLAVEPITASDALPEADLLRDHAAFGALSLVGRSRDGAHPFVFLPFKGKQGRLPLPAMQLVYCRSLDDVVRFAAPIGRLLVKRAVPFLILDAEGPVPGLPGFFVRDRTPKYFKGAKPPRLGDLAYTEFTIFGP